MTVEEGSKPSLEELRHFGVKGMKWGLRRGSSDGGPGRLRSAAAQALTDESRRRATATQIGGKAGTFGYNFLRGLVIPSLPGTAKTAERQKAAAKRILSGKTKATDIIRVIGNLTPMDLYITTSLKPGARGYDGKKS